MQFIIKEMTAEVPITGQVNGLTGCQISGLKRLY